jgi:hypothetical protein
MALGIRSPRGLKVEVATSLDFHEASNCTFKIYVASKTAAV